jgi:Tfp pilus assembly protein PilX
MLLGHRVRDVRPRDERGFSIIVAIVVLATVSLLLVGAIDAVLFNTQSTRTDLDQKRALLAADAGLSVYEQSLDNNPNFWTTCPTSGSVPGATVGVPVTVPGSVGNGSSETYAYENVPATGATGCSTTDPLNSMIEASGVNAGSFRVKVTGTSGPTTASPQKTISRSIVAQFAPDSFLQFVYFTNFESTDPLLIAGDPSQCGSYYWSTPPRDNQLCRGWINFVAQDTINGPFHSNDSILICGSPSFGATSTTATPDAVEAYGTIPGDSRCGTTSPRINGVANGSLTSYGAVGTSPSPLKQLFLPPDDKQLLEVAQDGNSSLINGCSTVAAGGGCVFTGPTTIQLLGTNTMTVTNANLSGGQLVNQPFPPNGVVYVQDGGSGCQVVYKDDKDDPVDYNNNLNCGNATVEGQNTLPQDYTSSLTIAADNDVIINSSITTTTNASGQPTGTALLGLIATGFVRIAHPCVEQTNTNTSSGIYNTSTSPTIDAAILSVKNSFIVDNYYCGSQLGTLTIWGAIAQDFRGVVGMVGDPDSGYYKNYNYDTRLKALEPPYFLNPVNAGWQVARETECDTSC